jgi:hypothetical protein
MIVKIALKAPNNTIFYKTYLRVTAALVAPDTHVLQLFDRKKRVVAEYPSGSYLWWQKTSTPQLPLSRAAKLLGSPGV